MEHGLQQTSPSLVAAMAPAPPSPRARTGRGDRGGRAGGADPPGQPRCPPRPASIARDASPPRGSRPRAGQKRTGAATQHGHVAEDRAGRHPAKLATTLANEADVCLETDEKRRSLLRSCPSVAPFLVASAKVRIINSYRASSLLGVSDSASTRHDRHVASNFVDSDIVGCALTHTPFHLLVRRHVPGEATHCCDRPPTRLRPAAAPRRSL